METRIVLQVHSEHKHCLVFVTSSYVLNMIFSSMLLYKSRQRNQGSYLVCIPEISQCYISRRTQHLEFIFCVGIRNTIIENGHMKFHLNLWLCPFKFDMFGDDVLLALTMNGNR
jgi:hypothetical protein